MEKILKLIDILDPKLVDQLIYLDRLVKLYSRFLNTRKPAEIRSNGKILTIRFTYYNRYGYEHGVEGEFDIADIQKHINLYKKKISEAFVARHTNLRIIRDKQESNWKKYIKNAEV